jgi:hypothetical protein
VEIIGVSAGSVIWRLPVIKAPTSRAAQGALSATRDCADGCAAAGRSRTHIAGMSRESFPELPQPWSPAGDCQIAFRELTCIAHLVLLPGRVVYRTVMVGRSGSVAFLRSSKAALDLLRALP